MWINLDKKQIEQIKGALDADEMNLEADKLIAELDRQIAARDAQNEAWIDRAIDEYAKDGEIEIDGDAVVSESDDGGAYVMAWVFAEKTDEEKQAEEEAAETGDEA